MRYQLVLCMMAALLFSACEFDAGDDIELVSYVLTTEPTKKAYSKSTDTAWSVTGMRITGTYSDGKERVVSVTADSISPKFANATTSTTAWTIKLGNISVSITGITVTN